MRLQKLILLKTDLIEQIIASIDYSNGLELMRKTNYLLKNSRI